MNDANYEHDSGNDNFLCLPYIEGQTKRILYKIVEYSPLIDSSNITFEHWIKIAEDIKVRTNILWIKWTLIRKKYFFCSKACIWTIRRLCDYSRYRHYVIHRFLSVIHVGEFAKNSHHHWITNSDFRTTNRWKRQFHQLLDSCWKLRHTGSVLVFQFYALPWKSYDQNEPRVLRSFRFTELLAACKNRRQHWSRSTTLLPSKHYRRISNFHTAESKCCNFEDLPQYSNGNCSSFFETADEGRCHAIFRCWKYSKQSTRLGRSLEGSYRPRCHYCQRYAMCVWYCWGEIWNRSFPVWMRCHFRVEYGKKKTPITN